jgi:rubrerythrin
LSKRQSEEKQSAKSYDRLARAHPKHSRTLKKMAKDERRHARNLQLLYQILKRMRL